MNYPTWNVGGIGGPWVIGLISIFHVLIAWFAVGGGLYLPLAEAKAIKEGRTEWFTILKRHSKFFLVLTSVFGAVSGVAIWFAIGLVQPEGTSTLIHNFVFGWAMEWVLFVVELAAAAVYYYTWDRIPQKLHLKVGYLYAASSFGTLLIINGILSFMLTPGDAWLSVAGTGKEATMFWNAFFNPNYFPSLIMRALACAALAGIWAMITASQVQEPELQRAKAYMVKWSAKWLMPMFLLMPFILLWNMYTVPAENRTLIQLGITTIGSGQFTQITRIGLLTVMTSFTIAGVVYFFAYKYPREFNFGHAASVLFLAALATSSTEYAREAIRKPYVVVNHMYSNGLRKSEVEKFNRDGYLTSSMWLAKNATPMETGKAMFTGQCLSCHTEKGYRSMKKMIGERDHKSIVGLLKILHENKADSPYRKYMPPLVGTEPERAALAEYLGTLNAGGAERVVMK